MLWRRQAHGHLIAAPQVGHRGPQQQPAQAGQVQTADHSGQALDALGTVLGQQEGGAGPAGQGQLPLASRPRSRLTTANNATWDDTVKTEA